MKSLNVLYIHGVGAFGGASRSLYELSRTLREHNIKSFFIAPQGTSIPYFSEVASGIVVTTGITRFDNSRYSYYRGIRWLIIARELIYLPFTLLALLKARQTWKEIDIIHVNEAHEIVSGLLAKILFNVPAVIHIRCLLRVAPKSIRCRLMNWMLRKFDKVIAIDESVRATLLPDLPVIVIHNSFTVKSSKSLDLAYIEKLAQVDKSEFRIGFVGNLLIVKGLFDLLEAARIVCQHEKNIKVLIVGGTVRSDKGVKAYLLQKMGLAQDIREKIVQKIAEYQLQEQILLLGEIKDIQRVYENLDVLCFPSHYDAPGRPIFEAAFSGVPSITAINNPKEDTMISGETGLAVPPHDPGRLAEAILYFVNNPTEAKRMGKNAQELAHKNFDPAANASKMMVVYEQVLKEKGCVRFGVVSR